MDGAKMSKSKGNTVTPEMYFDTVGADALRLFHLFLGPPAEGADWTKQSEELIEGCARFLDRVYRLATGEGVTLHEQSASGDDDVRRAVHRTIAKVTEDLDEWSYNTGVAALMELVNTLSKWSRTGEPVNRATFDEAVDTLLLLLAPMTPHVTAELWEMRHGEVSALHAQRWPVADPSLVAQETVTMVVQVNGKVRDRLEVSATLSPEQAEALALASDRVREVLAGAAPSRVVARPPRLVNIIS